MQDPSITRDPKNRTDPIHESNTSNPHNKHKSKHKTWVTPKSKQEWDIPHEQIKSIAQQTKTDTTTPESKQEWDIPHDQIKSIAQLKAIKYQHEQHFRSNMRYPTNNLTRYK